MNIKPNYIAKLKRNSEPRILFENLTLTVYLLFYIQASSQSIQYNFTHCSAVAVLINKLVFDSLHRDHVANQCSYKHVLLNLVTAYGRTVKVVVI